MNRTATILNRSEGETEDRFGEPENTDSAVEVLCDLQQRQRDEREGESETSDADWNLFLPAGTTFRTGDAVVVDGLVYEAVGAPWPVWNPSIRGISHIECTVRRTAGTGDDEDGS